MPKKISYYEIVITTTERRLANETKKRVDKYDMNGDAVIRVVYEDKPRCPQCQRVLRKEELRFGIDGKKEYCPCGEHIDYNI